MFKQEQALRIVDNLHRTQKRTLKFFNKMQREAMVIQAHDEYYVCARGIGKSEGLDARFILRNVWAMPGSTGALLSPSYMKAWGNTLPAICHALASWGYYEGVHYYVGRKAPKSANFKNPKNSPLRDAWGNCLHFWNGTIMVVISFASPMSANSMSLDWVIGPEAKFLNYEKIKNEVNPANRGNRQYFDDCPWHHSVMYTTDMPTSKFGKWILEKENDMQPEHINYIKNLYLQLRDIKKMENPSGYWRTKQKELEFDLALARRYQIPKNPDNKNNREYTVFYGEYDIFDNLEIVGEDFIWQMKRDLPDLIFRTAILNQRIFKVADCFYSALDDDIHFYIPDDKSDRGVNKSVINNCLKDSDCNLFQPLHIAFDANSAICEVCVGQPNEEKREMRTINSMYVKTPLKLQDLVEKFCEYYQPMTCRDVVFYFDTTFIWTSGTTDQSYADVITDVLKQNHFNVIQVHTGNPVRHDWKHMQIDLALKGDPKFLFPLFNLENNEYLKIAMERTGIKQGRNGFEKDKSCEKTPDTKDNPDEYKTHITDAWDELFLGMNFYSKTMQNYDVDIYMLQNN